MHSAQGQAKTAVKTQEPVADKQVAAEKAAAPKKAAAVKVAPRDLKAADARNDAKKDAKKAAPAAAKDAGNGNAKRAGKASGDQPADKPAADDQPATEKKTEKKAEKKEEQKGEKKEKKAAVAAPLMRALQILVAPAVAVKREAEEAAAEAAPAEVVEGAVAFDVAVDVAGGDGENGLAQQFMQQFRPVMKAELHFVRKVCQPTPEQRQKLVAAGEAALKEAVARYVDVQQKMMQGKIRFVAGNQESVYPDPRKIMQQSLARVIKEDLSEEQSARYVAENEKRASHRKRAAVLVFVSRLDEDLVLTANQREKLTAALTDNWTDTWGQTLEMIMYGNDYYPPLPEKVVGPLLNEAQLKTWRGKQNNNIFWGGMGFNPGIMMFDDGSLDDPESADAKAANRLPEANEVQQQKEPADEKSADE